MVIYEAFVEGKLEAPKHLARTVHDLYFEPKYEDFKPRTIWSLSNAFTSAFKELILCCQSNPALIAEDVLVQVLIAELALRVVLPTQVNKLRHLLVNTLQFCRRRCKQLSPVRPRMKRG